MLPSPAKIAIEYTVIVSTQGFDDETKLKDLMMKLNLRICFFIALLVNYGVALAEPASKESVRSLMIKMGAEELYIEGKKQMGRQMLPLLKRTAPEVSDQLWIKLINEMNVDAMIENVIPVYQKHLTEDEVKELISFYDSEVGKKYVSVLPAITKESMILGQQWGRKQAQDIFNKYKAEANTTQP